MDSIIGQSDAMVALPFSHTWMGIRLHFANGFEATFEFRGGVDIGEIGRIISEFVL